ncbi:hypothetical protein DPMN_139862 [Dreissena polymorpha]|uniref:Uncharacterized protein n=1 Tax=Dreissena polymorpha TaxID=45954 RepID=A0A9D4G728_DREPO|nr:hypothetical protein DPMN_139862 [Dreissena polymorpha]
MIALSSIGHPIWCKLYDIELLSSGVVDTSSSHIQPSEKISNFMSCDMSNIKLHVKAGSSELFEMFRDTSIPVLSLGTTAAATNASEILPTLCKLEELRLFGSYIDRFDLQLPVSLQRLVFEEGCCSGEWLCSLMIALSSIGHTIWCELSDIELLSSGVVDTSISHIQPSEKISNFMSCDMSNITLHVKAGSSELFEMFRDTSIPVMSLGTAAAATNASEILPTLCKLEALRLWGSYIGRFDLQLPVSLQKLVFEEGYCSGEWLCSLMIALSSIGHPIWCKLYDIELLSSGVVDTSSSHIQPPEKISNFMSCDMSNIKLHVKAGSSELFEMFRDTSIPVLSLGTTAAATNASEILPTLCKLEELRLFGSYIDRFDLQLPVSLQRLVFEEGCCSGEWLCSLMIALSSIGHTIWCELSDIELLSSGVVDTSISHIQPSEKISNFMSCDMSNITLHVKAGSSELFEMFRDTSIPVMSLGTAAAATNASEILPTLCKLEALCLWGSYIGRFDLQLPVSLQKLVFEEGYCSGEWLCSLMIALSSIGHPIWCKLYDIELLSSGVVDTSSSHIQPSEKISNFMSCDMSNIKLHVKAGSSELFEMFRDTSIPVLSLGTAAAATNASEILPTLCKLETLHLWGSYMGRFELQLPVSLKKLSFEDGCCSTEWLCSLTIAFSSIGHPIWCKLYDIELLLIGIVDTHSSQIQPSEQISNLLSCDMSNISLHVQVGSSELFEMFRDTSISALSFGTAAAASLASEILSSLCKLEILHLRGSYTGRFDL